MLPSEVVVLTDDPALLQQCFPDLPDDRVMQLEGRWPTFNRSGGVVADSVVLLDRYGLQIEAVAYPGLSSSSAGRSLERVDLYPSASQPVWVISSALEGATPGRSGDRAIVSVPPPGQITVSPNPFSSSDSGTLQVIVTTESVGRVAARVFDVAGREVSDLGVSFTSPSVFLWDGNDHAGSPVRSGLYIVACELSSLSGQRYDIIKVVVGCVAD